MATRLSGLLRKHQVTLRRCRDVNDVEFALGKHEIKIGVPTGNGIAERHLFGENRLKIANGDNASASKLLNRLDMAVGDFPAANLCQMFSSHFRLPLLLVFVNANSSRTTAALDNSISA